MSEDKIRGSAVGRTLKNLFVQDIPTGVVFKPQNPGWRRDKKQSQIQNKVEHANRLSTEFKSAWRDSSEDSFPSTGSYVTFHVQESPDFDLKKLENYHGKDPVQLRSAKSSAESDAEGITANVFIPDGRKDWFNNKLNQYRATDGKKEVALIENIHSIARTGVRELWTDTKESLPKRDNQKHWWEVWISTEGGANAYSDFTVTAEASGIKVNSDAIRINDRTVTLAYGSRNDFEVLIDRQTLVSELRRPSELAVFILNEGPAGQLEWVNDLVDRTIAPAVDAPAVCILDQGVHRSNPLLIKSLSAADCHAAKTNSQFAGGHDPLSGGHGTEMAGLALYHDLSRHLDSTQRIALRHRLESVKIIPNGKGNDPQLYGAITAMAVSHPEIRNPDRPRVYMLAVTAHRGSEITGTSEPGLPTVWSATLDALAFGRAVDFSNNALVYLDRDEPRIPRLFIVSVGNVDLNSANLKQDHLERSDISPIEDPSQAWNVISVGSYAETDVIDPDETTFAGYSAVAQKGDLSPVSRTGTTMGKGWPVKPDVVASGGNWAISPCGTSFDKPLSFQHLTTNQSTFGRSILTTTSDTSAATAKVAAIAADIIADYPEYKLETVRGLIVHSARWTGPMLDSMQRESLNSRAQIIRRYGMGVPSLERAKACAQNSINLITEGSIKPFLNGKVKEIVWHNLPWPKSELLTLGDTQVQMRVTLSYFVEPNPSARGWSGRYAYQSHGLRFDNKAPGESREEFHARLNQADRDDDYSSTSGGALASGWFLGRGQRKNRGSIHSDIWNGSAADLAEMGEIAVYPVSGWWKEKQHLDQSEKGVDYSLIISLETEKEVDLWTPISIQIANSVSIDT